MNTQNPTPEHPANEELAAFALGKATPNAETIAEHVANCARCETLLAKTPRDTFVSILHKAKPGSSATGPNVPKPAPATADDLPDELRQQSKYTFLKRLGGGGMGVVYLAEHNLMKRKVAVKLIPPEMIGNTAVRERFLQEVVSAAALEHANVVRAYSAEQFGPHMAFEMEFVDGMDLGQVIKTKGPLPVAHAVNYIRQAAQALQHGMQKSLVHRDIKPGNLMLTHGNVKVADFGLAKFSQESDKGRDHSLTGANAMMGTPDYMAPEQARNAKSADIRADIYSLGCTFYYLLTGQPPFAGESITDLIFKHWEASRPDVALLRNDAPAELAQFIQRMMAKEPGERPQTPKEVVDWLTKFAKGAPAKAETDVKPKEKKEKTVVASEEKPHEVLQLDEVAPEPKTRKTSTIQMAARPKKKWPLLAGAIACLLVVVAILAAAGVFRVKTKDGTIVLENLPPDADVTIDGGTATIASNGQTFEIRVAADKTHRLEVKKDGFKLFGSEVEVDVGGRKSIIVSLEPIKPPVAVMAPKVDRKPVPVVPTVRPTSSEGFVPKEPSPTVQKPAEASDPPAKESIVQAPPEVPPSKPSDDGFEALFNGKDLTGWKTHVDQPGDWKVEKGILIGRGPGISHLFTERADFTDFRIRAKVRVNAGGNSGIYVRSGFGPAPQRAHPAGYEAQIYPTGKPDEPKTGSLLHAGTEPVSVTTSPVGANEWFTMEVVARANQISVLVNGKVTATKIDSARQYISGRIALQVWDNGSDITCVEFESIEIKDLSPPVQKQGDQAAKVKTNTPDPLEKARLVYVGERKLHAKELTDAFETAIRNFKGTTAEATKKVQMLTDAKNQFTVNGLIPFSRPMRAASTVYCKSERLSQKALRFVWQPEIDKARNVADINRTRKLEADLKDALDIKPVARIGGMWPGLPLLTDGTINGTESTWSLVGGKLILRWKDAKAPGGYWIDTGVISDDGLSYAGENQIRVKISGRFVFP